MSTWSPYSSLIQPLQYPIDSTVYKEKIINLDGYRFKNCAFVNCVLRTTKGNFMLDACFFGGTTQFYFLGDAVRVVQLASFLDWENVSPTLRPGVNPDGSVTIK